MKGVASWIWVVGSVLFGLILLFAGYVLITGQLQTGTDRMILGEVSNLQVEVKRVCVSEGIGAIRTYEISLPESIKAIYAARSEYSPPPDKVSVLISNRESGSGSYLCYQLASNENNLPKKCWNFSCSLNFTYIGTPTMKRTITSEIARILGNTPIYTYKLHISKTSEHSVLVEAESVIRK